MSKIQLHDIEGSTVLSGVDDHGCQWIQFEVDWLCLDGGNEVCSHHVESPAADTDSRRLVLRRGGINRG